MKIINHRDGSRSFRFAETEQCVGAPQRQKALTTQASVTGGIHAFLADLIEFNEDQIVKYTTAMGSRALTILWELCLRSEQFPFGQGCKKQALKRIAGE